MEYIIINLIGNLKIIVSKNVNIYKSDRKFKKKKKSIQKCEYLFSAIAKTEFSETQLFLQTSLYVEWRVRSACASAQSEQSSPHAV